MAHSPRGWTGARTPSGKKRVRQAERRAAINGPRTSKAKTLVSKTIKIATGQVEGDANVSLAEAFSALDPLIRRQFGIMRRAGLLQRVADGKTEQPGAIYETYALRRRAS